MTEAASTMPIEVHLFGRYRDLSAASTLVLELPTGSTVADLVAELHRRRVGPLPPRPVVAVNHAPAPDVLILKAGDDVALIPPVAGG